MTIQAKEADPNEPERLLFTPYAFPDTRMRAHLMISREDMGKFDALPLESEDTLDIFDLVSQTIYTIKRTDCGAGCRCAAVVVGTGESFAWKKITDAEDKNDRVR